MSIDTDNNHVSSYSDNSDRAMLIVLSMEAEEKEMVGRQFNSNKELESVVRKACS